MNIDIFLQSQSDVIMFNDSKNILLQSQNDFLDDTAFKKRLQILPNQYSTIIQSNCSKQKDNISHQDSSKKQGSLIAGKKARQRKKQYVQTLEQSVKQLQSKINHYEQQIIKTKETLTQTINSTRKDQNSITYSQLKLCIQSEDPNQDKINLLLDMMKFRIGAVGHQRQAKIEYFFKQLINITYPALHRYLLFCSDKNKDLFSTKQQDIGDFFLVNRENQKQQKLEDNTNLSWTKQLMHKLDLTDKQKQLMLKIQPHYSLKYEDVLCIIRKLKQVQGNIKQQETLYENMIDDMRNWLTPVQGAVFILFAEKYKYKSQINMEGELEIYDPTLEVIGASPQKKRKTQ